MGLVGEQNFPRSVEPKPLQSQYHKLQQPGFQNEEISLGLSQYGSDPNPTEVSGNDPTDIQ